MRHACLATAVFTFMGALPQVNLSGAKATRPQQPISQIEAEATKASLQNDTAFFENLMADDYFGIGPAGNLVSKNQAIAERKSGALQWQDIKASEERLQVFGDIAVTTGLWAVKGTMAGHDISGSVRYTRIYRNVNGTWKLIHNQLTSVAQ